MWPLLQSIAFKLYYYFSLFKNCLLLNMCILKCIIECITGLIVSLLYFKSVLSVFCIIPN